MTCVVPARKLYRIVWHRFRISTTIWLGQLQNFTSSWRFYGDLQVKNYKNELAKCSQNIPSCLDGLPKHKILRLQILANYLQKFGTNSKTFGKKLVDQHHGQIYKKLKIWIWNRAGATVRIGNVYEKQTEQR